MIATHFLSRKMKREFIKAARRRRRQLRVRRKVFGTKERPRLSVYRSLAHIYCQVIDDTTGTTLAAASTLTPELREAVKGLTKTAAAKIVGQQIARAAIKKGIIKVVFDRRGMPYHGRVKALAEGAREGGLQF